MGLGTRLTGSVFTVRKSIAVEEPEPTIRNARPLDLCLGQKIRICTRRNDEYHVWILIVRITEMIFQIGRSGGSDDDIQLLKHLILRHNILTEEVEGLKSCVVTLHNLIHYPEDIKRFSSPDNYWC